MAKKKKIRKKRKKKIKKEINTSANLRMTFITPLSRSMVARKFERNRGGIEIYLNELSKNNSSNKINKNRDSNNITTKDYFPKLKININNDPIINNRNTDRIINYQDKKEKVSRTYKEKGNFKNININISSGQENITLNNNNNNEINELYNINTNNQIEEKDKMKSIANKYKHKTNSEI